MAHPKSKKLSFGPNISFDDIWNVHPLQFKDPVWDQPRFAFQACEKVAHSGCMVSLTSIFLRAESLRINDLGYLLVTMSGLGPCSFRGDELGGDGKVAVDLLDVGFGRGGFADTQR